MLQLAFLGIGESDPNFPREKFPLGRTTKCTNTKMKSIVWKYPVYFLYFSSFSFPHFLYRICEVDPWLTICLDPPQLGCTQQRQVSQLAWRIPAASLSFDWRRSLHAPRVSGHSGHWGRNLGLFEITGMNVYGRDTVLCGYCHPTPLAPISHLS